jgi:hypothetical protein
MYNSIEAGIPAVSAFPSGFPLHDKKRVVRLRVQACQAKNELTSSGSLISQPHYYRRNSTLLLILSTLELSLI